MGERQSAVPQLAWHLVWHIAALPRPLPARSNVAVDKPIKKPLLNALTPSASLSLSAPRPRLTAQAPGGGVGWGGGGGASTMEERERRRAAKTERKGGRPRSVCLRDFTGRLDDKTLFGKKSGEEVVRPSIRPSFVYRHLSCTQRPVSNTQRTNSESTSHFSSEHFSH